MYIDSKLEYMIANIVNLHYLSQVILYFKID